MQFAVYRRKVTRRTFTTLCRISLPSGILCLFVHEHWTSRMAQKFQRVRARERDIHTKCSFVFNRTCDAEIAYGSPSILTARPFAFVRRIPTHERLHKLKVCFLSRPQYINSMHIYVEWHFILNRVEHISIPHSDKHPRTLWIASFDRTFPCYWIIFSISLFFMDTPFYWEAWGQSTKLPLSIWRSCNLSCRREWLPAPLGFLISEAEWLY